MRTLMLKRFEGLVRRSAFVVGVVLDEEETKMEIMLDPVRASRALTHTLKILFMLQEHSGDGGARAAPTSSAFFSPFFLPFQRFRGQKLVGPESVSGRQKWRLLEQPFAVFTLANYLAVLMEMQRVIISALRE